MSEKDRIIEAITAALDETAFEQVAALREELRDVEAMFAVEDRGWMPIDSISAAGYGGLSLDQLKEKSAFIRERVVGVPIIKRAVGLRTSYVFSKGVNIPGLPEIGDERSRGRRSKLEKFCENPINRRNFFEPTAYEKMESAAATDGVFLLLGDNTKREVRPVPLSEITGFYSNPDFVDEIWAYRREWTHVGASGKAETKKSWIFTDTCPVPVQERPKSIGEGQDKIGVDSGKTILDIHFNTQTGWPLGVPDAIAAVVWARIYTELMQSGKTMTDALAKIAYKATTGSKAGAANIGAQLRQPGSGKTAAIGTDQDLLPMSSAGRTYDFNGIRPVAALVATAMEVSVVHLLSDPGAAGSSYGSAANLDLPTKRAMVSRQNLWAGYFERVLRWGADHDVTVTFPGLDDPDPYRDTQRAALVVNSGLLHPDESRAAYAKVADIELTHDTVPEGYLQPNNEESLARRDIDTDGLPHPTDQAASPDQGVANGSSGVDSTLANDIPAE